MLDNAPDDLNTFAEVAAAINLRLTQAEVDARISSLSATITKPDANGNLRAATAADVGNLAIEHTNIRIGESYLIPGHGAIVNWRNYTQDNDRQFLGIYNTLGEIYALTDLLNGDNVYVRRQGSGWHRRVNGAWQSWGGPNNYLGTFSDKSGADARLVERFSDPIAANPPPVAYFNGTMNQFEGPYTAPSVTQKLYRWGQPHDIVELFNRGFLDLKDTPSSFESRKFLRANSAGTALEQVNEPVQKRSISTVGKLPSTEGEALVYLTHDYTEGTKSDVIITVGFGGSQDDRAGYDTGNFFFGAIGSSNKSLGPIEFILGADSSPTYSITQIGSFNSAFLDEMNAVEIGGTEYTFAHEYVSQGMDIRDLASPPTTLSGPTFTFNLKRTDGTWYFTDGTTTRVEAGLYEWDGSQYSRVTTVSSSDITSIGPLYATGTIPSGTHANNIILTTVSWASVDTDAGFSARTGNTHQLSMPRRLPENRVIGFWVVAGTQGGGDGVLDYSYEFFPWHGPQYHLSNPYQIADIKVNASNHVQVRIEQELSSDETHISILGAGQTISTITEISIYATVVGGSVSSDAGGGQAGEGDNDGVASLSSSLSQVTLWQFGITTPSAPIAHWRFDDEWNGVSVAPWYPSRASALENAMLNPAFSSTTYSAFIATEQTRRRIVNNQYTYTDYGYTIRAEYDTQYRTDANLTPTDTVPSLNQSGVQWRNREPDGSWSPWRYLTAPVSGWIPIWTNEPTYSTNISTGSSKTFSIDLTDITALRFRMRSFNMWVAGGVPGEYGAVADTIVYRTNDNFWSTRDVDDDDDDTTGIYSLVYNELNGLSILHQDTGSVDQFVLPNNITRSGDHPDEQVSFKIKLIAPNNNATQSVTRLRTFGHKGSYVYAVMSIWYLAE